jgi:hypothetical protein
MPGCATRPLVGGRQPASVRLRRHHPASRTATGPPATSRAGGRGHHRKRIAIRKLCRATTSRRMRPSDVSALLADLAAATAVFPPVATQLGDILNRANHDFRLEMDTMAPRRTPPGCRDCQAPSWRDPRSGTRPLPLLDAAHNETAHIASTVRPVHRHRADPRDSSSRPRPEDRPPPGPTGPGPYVPR